MLVNVPKVPSFDPESSKLEKLVTELGYPPVELDEESEDLADTLVQEYAVFARRGWLYRFDMEFELDPETYAAHIAAILDRAGVADASATAEDDTVVVEVGGRRVSAPISAIEQDENVDWLDVDFVVRLAATALAPSNISVCVDIDEQSAVVAVLPAEVWKQAAEADLTGEFGVVVVD
jgi:hypothetical protein